jgi:hypothetical protein
MQKESLEKTSVAFWTFIIENRLLKELLYTYDRRMFIRLIGLIYLGVSFPVIIKRIPQTWAAACNCEAI